MIAAKNRANQRVKRAIQRRRMKEADVYPVILAAGNSVERLFPARGHASESAEPNAFEIAMENCAGMRTPMIVLGADAVRLAALVPKNAHVAINPNWRVGQLSSLLAGLRRVPRGAAFMLYPVNLTGLTPAIVRRLVKGFAHRRRGVEIVMPRHAGRAGHPVIFSGKLRDELRKAETARQVVYRKTGRVAYVAVRSDAIWKQRAAAANIGGDER